MRAIKIYRREYLLIRERANKKRYCGLFSKDSNWILEFGEPLFAEEILPPSTFGIEEAMMKINAEKKWHAEIIQLSHLTEEPEA